MFDTFCVRTARLVGMSLCIMVSKIPLAPSSLLKRRIAFLYVISVNQIFVKVASNHLTSLVVTTHYQSFSWDTFFTISYPEHFFVHHQYPKIEGFSLRLFNLNEEFGFIVTLLKFQ